MDQEEPLRVGIVQRVVPGYRVPVFERLGADPDVELTVLHGSNPLELARGNTGAINPDSFELVELPTRAVSAFGLHLVWFPGLIGEIRDRELDVVVCPASPSLLSVVVLLLYATVGDVGFVWWGKSLGSKAEVTPVGRLLRWVADAFRHPLYRLADACVCYSSAAADYFRSYGVADDDIYLAYNSTDTSRMRELEATYRDDEEALGDLRQAYQVSDRDVLFFVGTHTPEKHIDNLIEAHQQLAATGRDTTLVIAGSGPETERLRANAADDPHVTFTDRISDEELVRHLLVADVFVMPGHGGLAVQQAMTLGLPIVTTPLDGTETDLISEGENGHLVESDDIDALAEGIDTVLSAGPDGRRKMGARSRQIVDERVNLDRMIAGFRSAIGAAADTSLPPREP